ncbi:hypothetical protein PC128_g16023 [Phytophthora cactorum]|nr:hypothetical protein PC128_g16023 [Phytophthora cactorum]
MTRSQSVSSMRATLVMSLPPSSVPASPVAAEDSPQAIPSAKDDSRGPVPLSAGGETAPEAPARTGEASQATKKVTDSTRPSTPPHEAGSSAEKDNENEAALFRGMFESDDEDEDPTHWTHASSLSAVHKSLGATYSFHLSSDEDSLSSDEGSHDYSLVKRPSLPSSPPSTPMGVDDDGGRSREDVGGVSREDESSFDFPSGDTGTMKLFLSQPRVQAQLVMLESYPHPHALVFLVAKVLQPIPAIKVTMKER